jgi:hypothetical protein
MTDNEFSLALENPAETGQKPIAMKLAPVQPTARFLRG